MIELNEVRQEIAASGPGREVGGHEPVILVSAGADGKVGEAVEGRDGWLSGFVASARELVERLRRREDEFARLMQITERVNYGVVLEEILEYVYQEMRQVIPYNRIGFSLIDPERGTVVARWAKSDRAMSISAGYEASLAGSTLQRIIETGRPRIINDLEAYHAAKPSSDSTARLVGEGMRSSLTCPLLVQGRPVGFIFFSSDQKNTYSNVHVAFFRQIAGQLAATVEKGQLYTKLAEQAALIEAQNQAITRDLTMARTVQRALIPGCAPHARGLDIAFEYEPAIQVGGDILDIVTLKDDRVLLFVGDAMGHGVKAALVMSVVKTALRGAVQTGPSPGHVLTELNKLLASLFEEDFVTAACCIVDPATGGGEVSLAGHPAPICVRGISGDYEQVGEADVPLGVVAETAYQDRAFAFSADDVLCLYTDGLVEAAGEDKRFYGVERLRGTVGRHRGSDARDILEGIKSDLRSHCGQEAMADDLAILIVKAVR